MDAPITITQRELLSISPEVRSQYKNSTTTWRMPYNNGTTAQNYRKIETEDGDNQQLLATVTNIQPTYAFLLTEESTKNTSVPSIIPDITTSPPLQNNSILRKINYKQTSPIMAPKLIITIPLPTSVLQIYRSLPTISDNPPINNCRLLNIHRPSARLPINNQ